MDLLEVTMLSAEEQGTRLSTTMDYIIKHNLKGTPVVYFEYIDGEEEFIKHDMNTESSKEFFSRVVKKVVTDENVYVGVVYVPDRSGRAYLNVLFGRTKEYNVWEFTGDQFIPVSIRTETMH